jgi:hypothetical protein
MMYESPKKSDLVLPVALVAGVEAAGLGTADDVAPTACRARDVPSSAGPHPVQATSAVVASAVSARSRPATRTL